MQYRLEDLCVLVLQNLPDVTIDQVNIILQYIDYTRCVQYKPVFEYAKGFYEQNEAMPDEDYMMIQFEQVFYNTNIPWHNQLATDFVNFITTESVAVQSQRALQEGNYKKALGIIQGADRKKRKKVLTMNEVLAMWKENRKEYSTGMKLGIKELDGLYKFLAYKTLNVIAAPPANFKTTVAISAAMDAVLNQNLNVVYITLEDTSEVINHDMLAALAGIKKIPVTAEEIKRYLLPDERVGLIDDLVNIWNTEVPGKFAVLSARECDSMLPSSITKELEDLYEEWDHKLDVVIVDHFNIWNEPIPGLNLQGPQLAKYYVRYMTNLSISFGHKGFILIGLAQINREGQLKLEKGKELNGSELADTSELHRSATTVTSLYADDTDRINGLLRMKNIKNRLGAQGQCFMVPIKPEVFKVGDDITAMQTMNIQEFEKLAHEPQVQVDNSGVNFLLSAIGATELQL